MEPVYTKGNVFYRADQRFLIKGISYIPRYHSDEPWNENSLVDPLTDDRIPDLERDIPVLQQLGLNTIQVVGLDPTRSHSKAMSLLSKSGIYVVARVCSKMKMPEARGIGAPNIDPARYYTLALMRRALRIVDELADHSNMLGFSIDVSRLSSRSISQMAECYRAAVRDVKTLLQLRKDRKPPVGVHISDVADLRMRMLQYFTAGPAAERVDYFSFNCYSWASPSNFQISGWQHMAQAWQNYPVPSFLAEFGTNVNERRWDELSCLYSPDMTGVFSGGCIYTYFENGNNYGIVKTTDDGEVERRQPEFWKLKAASAAVNARAKEEVHTDEIKDYENWSGAFPAVQNNWLATSNLPDLPATVEAMYEEMQKEKAQQLAEEVSKMDLSDLETECRLPSSRA